MDVVAFATDRLAIRPWRREDAAWYLAAMDDEVIQWTREDRVPSVGEWLASHVDVDVDSPIRWSAIARGDADDPVGCLGIERLDDAMEVSYWIASQARRQGFATEALSGTITWASRFIGAGRLELRIHPDNAASIDVAEASGFSFAGWEASCRSCADHLGRVAVYALDV